MDCACLFVFYLVGLAACAGLVDRLALPGYIVIALRLQLFDNEIQ